MWKLSFLALAVSFNLHADQIGAANEMGGDDPDDHKFAVTPGNPGEGDDPITGEKNDKAACLSADTIKRYEVKSRNATAEIKKRAEKNAAGSGHSLRQVRLALQAAGLIPKKLNSLGGSAKDSIPAFKNQKFVNLMDCKEWRDKIKGGNGEIPLGAVLIFKGGRHGDARIKTAEGCSQGEGKDLRCSMANRPLAGVMVKLVN